MDAPTAAPEATKRLTELCDHLPLALQIVAALLADEPDRPIVELVDELASEEDRLNSLDYDTDLSVEPHSRCLTRDYPMT